MNSDIQFMPKNEPDYVAQQTQYFILLYKKKFYKFYNSLGTYTVDGISKYKLK